MATVQTVQGPIEGEDLGTVLIHEHVRFRDDAVARQWPVAYDREEELSEALEAVRAAAERGVRTICDATVMFGGRDGRADAPCQTGGVLVVVGRRSPASCHADTISRRP